MPEEDCPLAARRSGGLPKPNRVQTLQTTKATLLAYRNLRVTWGASGVLVEEKGVAMFEQVFVVPREELFPRELDAPEGFSAHGVEAFLERIGTAGFFVDRGMAERDPALKQIIPYGLLCSGSGSDELVFTLKSGNFGAPDFFETAAGVLGGNEVQH